MKCPKCQFDNREGVKFCEECGTKFELECPACKAKIPIGRKFCGECGYTLTPAKDSTDKKSQKKSLPSYLSTTDSSSDVSPMVGERKHVTALFSDISGYTAMSEMLDPEEVKEISSKIFDDISKIISKYDGFIEKFAGDAVMAMFGAEIAHEDDPIRAIRAAREIHHLVNDLSPQYEERIEHPLSMHTGINTGLVVTGEINLEKGTHGVAGDPLNLASRLSGLAKPDEIIVGPNTYRRAEGYFSFKRLELTEIKGKDKPIQTYRVMDSKERPVTIHGLSGVRADLIGRKVEITGLRDAVKDLLKNDGKIFTICGDAGTGKSRLVDEFKASLNLEKIQWLEGRAYAYAQNIPYFPLVDLLNRIFQIEEDDSPDAVRQKLESGMVDLVGLKKDAVPYLGRLYSLQYTETESISPEFWKSKIHEVGKTILSALAQRAPTVFLLEDLHWADPSFIEFLRNALLEIRQPAVVLCVYRPVFSLFTAHQERNIAKIHQEIRIKDLSSSEAQYMLESLLKTESIPSELRRFVQNKAEGNPFYLEELINSLIESGALIQDNNDWKLTKSITKSNISSTIHGVISGRLDRLEKETKRILQEASVIGRAFLYNILKQITVLKFNFDTCLSSLERLDLIRTRSFQPDLEYVFKHALAQEVVYNGILIKERKEIHERIAVVIEQLFSDRLPEFYETLAFHFSRGQSVMKAIDYLIKSGKKSIDRYSVTESHQYYKEAFELYEKKTDKTKEENESLIDLIIEWAYVFYYRGDFKGMEEVLKDNISVAESLENKVKIGMYYSWYGWSLGCQNKLADSDPWLKRALQIGEEIEDQRVIGYACTWLTWGYLTKGDLKQALQHGERAQEISKTFKSDAYLYFKSLAGLGFANMLLGEKKKAIKIANALVEYGKKYSNIRSLTMGYSAIGNHHRIDGNFIEAINASERAIKVGAEPFYTEYIRMNLALLYLLNDQINKAENALNSVVAFSTDLGAEVVGVPANAFLGAVLIAKGHMSQGLKQLEDGNQELLKSGNLLYYLQCEYIIGKVYSQIAMKAAPLSVSKIARNLGFVMKNVPFASKKAEGHFKKVIEVAGEIGAIPILGGAYLDLGLLYKAKGKNEQARKCISQAVQHFQDCDAEFFLKSARTALSTL